MLWQTEAKRRFSMPGLILATTIASQATVRS